MVECQYDTNQVYPNPQKVEDIVSRQPNIQHSIHKLVQVDFNIITAQRIIDIDES